MLNDFSKIAMFISILFYISERIMMKRAPLTFKTVSTI
ncbi:MAG: hypothetical protein RLZZ69_2608, partial [Cyanobacteriota bacterium]